MRKTGELTRVLDRGSSAVQNLLSTVLFQVRMSGAWWWEREERGNRGREGERKKESIFSLARSLALRARSKGKKQSAPWLSRSLTLARSLSSLRSSKRSAPSLRYRLRLTPPTSSKKTKNLQPCETGWPPTFRHRRRRRLRRRRFGALGRRYHVCHLGLLHPFNDLPH